MSNLVTIFNSLSTAFLGNMVGNWLLQRHQVVGFPMLGIGLLCIFLIVLGFLV